ncbi:MAG: acetyltransferase [Marinilabiliaceae bacterium]|nr:acetyltransferase [Marinilabiliaceae bacterium]
MLIAGSKGHAIEILQLLEENGIHPIAFFDDVTPLTPPFLYEKYRILTNPQKAQELFVQSSEFMLGLGHPRNRRIVFDKLIAWGGKCVSVIANTARIGKYSTLSAGANVMHHTFIGNNAHIGIGCLINSHSSIHHDACLGDFCEIAPGAKILGGASIGANTFIGANAVILPKVMLGSNVTIGAGAVITKNIPDNATAIGVPGRIIKIS